MNSVNRRKFLKITGAGGVTLLVSASMFSRGARADTIRVGGLHDRSGAIGIYGNEMSDALILAVDEINESGGLLGRQIELAAFDTQSTMQNYAQYAQRLALQEKADVVFGGITSASRETIRPIFDRYKKLYFYSTFYEGGVCDRTEFTNAETPAQINGPLLKYAMDKFGAKTVYTIAADYIYGQITADWLKKYARDFGGEVIAEEFFPLEVADFSSTITKIQAAKPDLVVSALVGGNHIGFYRQWPAAGMQGKIPVASTVFGPWENAFVTPEEAEGIMCSYHYFATIDTPANKAFLDKWTKRFGDEYAEIGTLAVCTYNSVNLWKKGVEMAGTVDRMPVIEALETGISTDGPAGKVTIDPHTHHTIMSAAIAEVHGGRFDIVDVVADRTPDDTASVCDLVANPNQAKMYKIEVD
jgi:branched-chain amino acid transport system substrate-binding protein